MDIRYEVYRAVGSYFGTFKIVGVLNRDGELMRETIGWATTVSDSESVGFDWQKRMTKGLLRHDAKAV